MVCFRYLVSPETKFHTATEQPQRYESTIHEGPIGGLFVSLKQRNSRLRQPPIQIPTKTAPRGNQVSVLERQARIHEGQIGGCPFLSSNALRKHGSSKSDSDTRHRCALQSKQKTMGQIKYKSLHEDVSAKVSRVHQMCSRRRSMKERSRSSQESTICGVVFFPRRYQVRCHQKSSRVWSWHSTQKIKSQVT